MIKKIDHLVITTSIPEKVLNFYEKIGFTSRDAGGRYELFAGDFKINTYDLPYMYSKGNGVKNATTCSAFQNPVG